MGAFDRYAPFVQDFIYAHSWDQLRSIQVAAADAIFNTDHHVLLTASTASGKTEAAFFPILTLLYEDPPASVGAIYIAPLKALINDQCIRLDQLCAEAGIEVWRWHGDAPASRKRKMLDHPSGILQITPESLEALLLRKHALIPRLFGDTRFIVIDELHSLLRGDRGGQTLCLIERLCKMAGCSPRRIGLSATIGDPRRAGDFLSAGTSQTCVIPRIEEPPKTWRLSIEHFYTTGPQAPQRHPDSHGPIEAEVVSIERVATQSQVSEIQELAAPKGSALHKKDALQTSKTSHNLLGDPNSLTATSTLLREVDPAMAYIFERTQGSQSLVFCNSREEAEAVCSTLRSYSEALGEPERFLIHHGNLSSSLREAAEDAMRNTERCFTTITTATLELGIDIGRLERAFQIDAPFTVSAFLQRMGRTGRRGTPPEMHFVMREDEPESRSLLPETIPWKLIQGIALIELYRRFRWVEPPRLDRLPYSLLCHQVLSVLASYGELTPPELASRILTLSYFHRISTDDLRTLLHHLIQTNYVEQLETGSLIVGITGERAINNYKFYAVFQDNEEYSVRNASTELGTIVNPPPAGERIAIAGRCWVVEDIDWKRRVVWCEEVKGRVPAYFGDCAGDLDTKILDMMQEVLAEDAYYPYLLPQAKARLSAARHASSKASLTDTPLINLGEDCWALVPWLGSYAFLALERVLKIKCTAHLGLKGLDSSRPYFMQFHMQADADTFFCVLKQQALDDLDPMSLLYPGEVPRFEKYDELVPDDLVRKGFAYGVLDIRGMQERVAGW